MSALAAALLAAALCAAPVHAPHAPASDATVARYVATHARPACGTVDAGGPITDRCWQSRTLFRYGGDLYRERRR